MRLFFVFGLIGSELFTIGFGFSYWFDVLLGYADYLWFVSFNMVALCGCSGGKLVWKGEERVDNGGMEFT